MLTELPPPTEPGAIVGSDTDYSDSDYADQPEEQLQNNGGSPSLLEQVPEKISAQSTIDPRDLMINTNQNVKKSFNRLKKS